MLNSLLSVPPWDLQLETHCQASIVQPPLLLPTVEPANHVLGLQPSLFTVEPIHLRALDGTLASSKVGGFKQVVLQQLYAPAYNVTGEC